MFQNLDFNSIVQLLLVIFVGIFMLKMSRVLDKLAEHKEEQSIEHVKVVKPIEPIGSVLKNNPTPIINNENKKKITLEIEFPDLPERIKVPYSKLPLLLELLNGDLTIVRNREELEEVLGLNKREEPEKKKEEAREEEKKENEIGTVSFMGHRESPWIDIVSKVSGLEFSGDGKKVYCPQHGWVDYIVTTDGRILCGYDYHTLFDPNKPKTYPIKKVSRMKKELHETLKEIQELRNKAALTMEIPEQTRDIEEENIEEEESIEEYEEE